MTNNFFLTNFILPVPMDKWDILLQRNGFWLTNWGQKKQHSLSQSLNFVLRNSILDFTGNDLKIWIHLYVFFSFELNGNRILNFRYHSPMDFRNKKKDQSGEKKKTCLLSSMLMAWCLVLSCVFRNNRSTDQNLSICSCSLFHVLSPFLKERLNEKLNRLLALVKYRFSWFLLKAPKRFKRQ